MKMSAIGDRKWLSTPQFPHRFGAKSMKTQETQYIPKCKQQDEREITKYSETNYGDGSEIIMRNVITILGLWDNPGDNDAKNRNSPGKME